MDPRPTLDQIASFYPKTYYTHNPANDPGRGPTRSRQVKDAILRKRFGYVSPIQAPPPVASALGCVLGGIRSYRDLAGYDVRYLHGQPGGRLFDVGCGSGAYLELMRTLGWQCEGLDPDPGAVEVAARRGFRVTHSTIEQFPDPTEPFDAITMSHVLEHVIDPAAVLRRLYGWLRPGGSLVSIFPNGASTLSRWYRADWVGLEPPRHLVLPSPQACRAAMQRMGAKVNVFTLTRAGAAYVQQSRNSRRLGFGRRYENSNPRLSKMISFMEKCTNAFHADRGNEVILIAEKP
jgi:2-polyprenyl-3-methyl-5-hydroxy-6-metoxy-1,4-benzoquinol methylase